MPAAILLTTPAFLPLTVPASALDDAVLEADGAPLAPLTLFLTIVVPALVLVSFDALLVRVPLCSSLSSSCAWALALAALRLPLTVPVVDFVVGLPVVRPIVAAPCGLSFSAVFDIEEAVCIVGFSGLTGRGTFDLYGLDGRLGAALYGD